MNSNRSLVAYIIVNNTQGKIFNSILFSEQNFTYVDGIQLIENFIGHNNTMAFSRIISYARNKEE